MINSSLYLDRGIIKNIIAIILYKFHMRYSLYIIQEGGFYSAEDADSLPEPQASAKREGAFYVWTYDELKSLLDKKVPGNKSVRFFDLICYHFNVKKEGNVRKTQVRVVI